MTIYNNQILFYVNQQSLWVIWWKMSHMCSLFYYVDVASTYVVCTLFLTASFSYPGPMNDYKQFLKHFSNSKHNHVGARHCRKSLGRRKGFNIFITLGFPKIRAFVWCGQILSKYFYHCTVGVTKTRAFLHKSC